MLDYSIMEAQLSEILSLSRRPVILAFRDIPPAGVRKFAGAEPSGCSFWKLAARGMTFYTVPNDHANCAMGSYTYSYDLSPEHLQELKDAFSQLSSSGLVRSKEISALPRMKHAPYAVVYSPLGETPLEPDLVVFVIRPMPAMILQEAALRTGIEMELSWFGTPACMSLTTVMEQGMVTGTGCLGSRTFADLGEDELYVLVAGRFLRKIADAVRSIAESNRQLKERHRMRQRSLSASIP